MPIIENSIAIQEAKRGIISKIKQNIVISINKEEEELNQEEYMKIISVILQLKNIHF